MLCQLQMGRRNESLIDNALASGKTGNDKADQIHGGGKESMPIFVVGISV